MTLEVSVLETRFTLSATTRACQAVWHDLLVEFAKAERTFRCNGHAREADQLMAYTNTINQHGVRHLERLLGASGNGHYKDSQDTADGLMPAGRPKNSPALADETCACTDGDGHEVGASPDAPTPVTVAVPSNNLEGAIQLEIDNLGDMMARRPDHHRPDHQPYEVALKMLHRGRSLYREGKHELAARQLRAARNTLTGAKEMDYR